MQALICSRNGSVYSLDMVNSEIFFFFFFPCHLLGLVTLNHFNFRRERFFGNTRPVTRSLPQLVSTNTLFSRLSPQILVTGIEAVCKSDSARFSLLDEFS